MFVGFNVTMDDKAILGDFYYNIGKKILESNAVVIEKSLKKYICNNKCLNGSLLQEDWFPQIKVDIFISHSHKNEELIISLAGWLYEIFGLKVFVDSCIWGYANDLLLLIDNDYCRTRQDNSNRSYSYDKRNGSTSHVHMMLSMALAKMIDNAECLFFINTPDSISIGDTVSQSNTLSPWIYAELQISEIIRHKPLEEYRPKVQFFEKEAMIENAELQMKYNVQLDHLVELNSNDLLYWWQTGRKSTCDYPLDVLYEYKNLFPQIHNI